MLAKGKLLAAAGALGLVVALMGCDAEGDLYPAETAGYASYGYVPAYYDGYPVYYDGIGRPYYYDNLGVGFWVAPASPYYVGLAYHYRTYGAGYRHWNAAVGARYRGSRVAPGYYGSHGRGYAHGYGGGFHGGGFHGGGFHGGGGHHR